MLALFTLAAALSADDAPEVWMAADNTDSLGEPEARWPFLKQHLDGLQFQINALAFLAPSGNLERLVPILKERGIAIGVEGAYFDWVSSLEDFSAPNRKPISDRPREDFSGDVGRITAETEIKKIVHLANAGGAPDAIFLDGPIRRMMLPGQDVGRSDIKPLESYEAVAEQVIAYMETWRASYPDIEFVLISNFPNWGWKGEVSYWGHEGYGDYHAALEAVLPVLKEAGVPLKGVRADNPYEYVMGMADHTQPGAEPASDLSGVDWMARLLDLERYVEAQGLAYGLVVNSQEGGRTSAEMFHERTLEFLKVYREAGGSPQRYIVHTWYPLPKVMWPEDRAFTLGHTTAEVIRRVKGVEQD